MHQEMQGDEHRCVGQNLINMEQEPMQSVFQQGPDHIAKEETGNCFCIRLARDGRNVG
jgi:hypothetical protein